MNEKTNNKKLIAIAVVLCLMVALIAIASVSIAKYIENNGGNAEADIAEMICTMDVVSSSEDNSGNVINPADKSIVNPYCIVTLRNFRGSDQAQPLKTTETDVKYTVTVTPKVDSQLNNFVMPAYNWYEVSSPSATSGTLVATSTDLTSAVSGGDFIKGSPETRYFKIVFLNSGERDITRYVDFNLNAIQVEPE